ncbi:hypothetical protein M3M38_00405 [Fructilactobacillus cliffordii]|uniref:DUF5978 domain-containing protein n=1 Tax=Fructilactobacillus cliffordii TaxID=2940299 RepID=UPI0020925052|nr:hypothetical protein [Fructilactobacillus cliffordii]USS86576.1 hypothetical protein M3M38_00405 [Fructilactobacillus cliffordii]
MKCKWKIIFSGFVVTQMLVAYPQIVDAAPVSSATVSNVTAQDQLADHIVNGSFEEPVLPANSINITSENNVPGWSTTAGDHNIEMMNGNGGKYHNFRPAVGNQWAEINANEPGELYQVVKSIPGTIMHWSLYHAGRDQTDTMDINIGTLTNHSAVRRVSSPNRTWTRYDGYYEVPDGQTETYFGFKSVTSKEPSYGNYIDGVEFSVYSKTPMQPVNANNGEVIPPSENKFDFPPVNGNEGDQITIDPNTLPDIPGYNKPKEPFTVTIPADGTPIDIPYTPIPEPETPSQPVDQNGNVIPHTGIDFPNYPGKPGDQITIDPNTLPDLPGYNKPQEPFTVTIPADGTPIDIPYTPLPEPETPSQPVDQNGKVIPHTGIDFPKYPGKPGDQITIDPNTLPDLPGYEKPKTPFTVTIPADGTPINIPYTPLPEPETPSQPVDQNGNVIPHTGIDFPKYPGKPGDQITIDPNTLPDLPGYEKPKTPFTVTIPADGTPINIPYTPLPEPETTSQPVDPNGKVIPHTGIDFPKYPGKPGDQITIDPNTLPDLPGYEKPKTPFTVTIPADGTPIDIPYTPLPEPETPSQPVDPNGKVIPHTGIDFPKYPGKPGDQITIDPNTLPDLPGYNKPKEPFTVTIPADGTPIDIPYTPLPEPETPSQPVDQNGKVIPHTGIDFPKYPGKPGDQITIDPNTLPDLPGYEKPKTPFTVTIPADGTPINIPYTPLPEPETTSQPVDPNGKVIPHTGIDFPKYPGKPGDQITIDPNTLPDIPGYNKPKTSFTVTIPVAGNLINIPYTRGSDRQVVSQHQAKQPLIPQLGAQHSMAVVILGLILLLLSLLMVILFGY